jgi:hypothetical protein
MEPPRRSRRVSCVSALRFRASAVNLVAVPTPPTSSILVPAGRLGIRYAGNEEAAQAKHGVGIIPQREPNNTACPRCPRYSVGVWEGAGAFPGNRVEVIQRGRVSPPCPLHIIRESNSKLLVGGHASDFIVSPGAAEIGVRSRRVFWEPLPGCRPLNTNRPEFE